MPTQASAPPAARLGPVRLQGAFPPQRAAGGPDAAARVSRRLWRHGAHRWRPRQPVVLHSPRPARALPATVAAGAGPGRRCSRISRRPARVSRWRCRRRRSTAPGCLRGRCAPAFARFGRDGIFAVGNAAAEAHPIVAEGISMAIQSATLLCEQLVARPDCAADRVRARPAMLDRIRAGLRAAWRRNFSRRLHMAAVFAHLFMRPVATRIATRLLERFPATPDRGRALERQGGAAAGRPAVRRRAPLMPRPPATARAEPRCSIRPRDGAVPAAALRSFRRVRSRTARATPASASCPRRCAESRPSPSRARAAGTSPPRGR